MRFSPPSWETNVRGYLALGIAVAGIIVCGCLLATAPRPVHAASLKQAEVAGAVVFHDKGCQHCHGADAGGTDRGPDLSAVGKKWHKDRIEQQIREGGGGMPAFGDVLQTDEIKSLVEFLSAKRKPLRKEGRSAGPENSPKQAKPSSDDSGE